MNTLKFSELEYVFVFFYSYLNKKGMVFTIGVVFLFFILLSTPW